MWYRTRINLTKKRKWLIKVFLGLRYILPFLERSFSVGRLELEVGIPSCDLIKLSREHSGKGEESKEVFKRREYHNWTLFVCLFGWLLIWDFCINASFLDHIFWRRWMYTSQAWFLVCRSKDIPLICRLREKEVIYELSTRKYLKSKKR